MPGVWDHDLWAEIYGIPDAACRQAVSDIYRLVLDMRESDVMAEKIAARVNKDRRMALSVGAKLWAACISLAALAQTVQSFRGGK